MHSSDVNDPSVAVAGSRSSFEHDVYTEQRDMELHRAVRALRALTACNQALVHAESEEALLSAVCRVVVENAGYRLAWVGYAEHDANHTVRPVAHRGFEAGYLERAAITWSDTERGRGPTGTAIRTRRVTICRNIPLDPNFAPWREDAMRRGYASSIVLPLMTADEVFGALNIYASEPDAFSTEETTLLGELAADLTYGLLALRDRDALREREAMHRAVFDHVSDALIVAEIGAQGELLIATMNASAERLAGVSASVARATGLPAFVEQSRLQDIEKRWRTCLQEGRPIDYAERRFVPGVGTREFLVTALPLPPQQGRKPRLLVVSHDITERRLAEVAQRTALLRSEENSRRLFETMVQGVVYQDSDGHVISMNPSAELILGRRREEFLGRTSSEETPHTVREDGSPFPGDEHPSMVALRTGREVRDVVMGVFNPAERQVRWIRVNAVPLFRPDEEKPYQVYTIFHDITARRASANRISRQAAVLGGINRIFRETLGSATDLEVATVFLDVVCQLTGSPLGLVGETNEAGLLDAITFNKEVRERCALAPGSGERMRSLDPGGYVGAVLREGTARYLNDLALDAAPPGAPPGHAVIRRFLGAPLREGARVLGLVGLANKALPYDDDDLRAVEEVVPAFVEALNRKRAQRAVLGLNQQLEGRARELEAANRELETFSYTVSHDLRTPLRSIEGISSILLEDFGPQLGTEGREHLGRLASSSRRMGELIDDLLKLARMSRAELVLLPTDLSAIAAEIADDLAHAQPGREAEWRIAAGVSVVCDGRLLRAALENLLGNAWKFTAERKPAIIEFGEERGAGQTVYFVRDNGAGFDMAKAGRLFTPFQRLHSAEQFPGTGVGLATVQRIIGRHGGRIWAEGTPGQGAVFRFTLGAGAPGA